MKFELVVTYNGAEAKLFGKDLAGEIKLSQESLLIMQSFGPKEAMLANVKGLYNKFVRDLERIVFFKPGGLESQVD